jgi:outer membrane protein
MSWKAQSLQNDNKQLAGEVALGALLPSIAMQASQSSGVSYYGAAPLYTIPGYSLPFNQTNVSMQLNIPLYAPASYKAYEVADISEKMSAADYALFQSTYAIELASRYFDVLKKDKSLNLAYQYTVMREKFYKDVQERYEVGLVALTDLREAQSALDQAKSSQIQADFALSQAQATLKTLIAVDVTALSDLSWDQDVRLPLRAIEQGTYPSLTKGQLTATYYQKQMEMYQAMLLPTLSGFSTYSRSPLNQSISHSINSINAGLTLSWSPPGGMATMAQVEQMSFLLQSSQAQYKQVALEHKTQRKLYAQQSYSLAQQIYAQRETVISASVYLDAVQASFDAGQRTTTDVLEAQQSLIQQQDVLYSLIYGALLMHLRLGLENSYDVELLLSDLDSCLNHIWSAPAAAIPAMLEYSDS